MTYLDLPLLKLAHVLRDHRRERRRLVGVLLKLKRHLLAKCNILSHTTLRTLIYLYQAVSLSCAIEPLPDQGGAVFLPPFRSGRSAPLRTTPTPGIPKCAVHRRTKATGTKGPYNLRQFLECGSPLPLSHSRERLSGISTVFADHANHPSRVQPTPHQTSARISSHRSVAEHPPVRTLIYLYQPGFFTTQNAGKAKQQARFPIE